MAKQPVCLVCQKEMVKGFVAELGPGAVAHLPRWIEGEPDPSRRTGDTAKPQQRERGAAVVAYRCPECEALRLYAPSHPTES